MRAVRATPSAVNLTWGVDTLMTLTKDNFAALAARSCAFRAGYIEVVTPTELANQLAAGISFVPVSFAMHLDGATEVIRLRDLGIPNGVTVWCDVEGQNLEYAATIARVNAWATSIQTAGFEAGMYVGAGCPLTATQLTQLVVTRYWHSVSRALEPSRGYCMRQIRPDDVVIDGLKLDIDIVEPDYNGDLPTFVTL